MNRSVPYITYKTYTVGLYNKMCITSDDQPTVLA